jgi:hypothetical protein
MRCGDKIILQLEIVGTDIVDDFNASWSGSENPECQN